MNNVIPLFKEQPKPDVSKESYFFSFAGMKFQFGGGAFTRDLLERIEPNRARIHELIQFESDLKEKTIRIANLPNERRDELLETIQHDDQLAHEILNQMHTPNDVDAFMTDDTTRTAISVVLSAAVYACYVTFDILRMERNYWCLVEPSAREFMDALDRFYALNPEDVVIVATQQ